MRHILHRENIYNQYRIAILTKDTAFNKASIEQYYVNPLGLMGIDPMDIISYNLKYNDKGKAPMSLIRSHLTNILKAIESQNITTILCNDSAYFKPLTGVTKTEPHHGYVKPCTIKGYEYLNIVLGINYHALFHNPLIQDKLTMSLKTVARHMQGTYVELGTGIIHSEYYPYHIEDIKSALAGLHAHSMLTCDIETFSLSLDTARIGTIAFAWDQHNGLAFSVEYGEALFESPKIKDVLKIFFTTYKGTLVFHGSSFDIKHLIYNLFMHTPLDRYGMVKGLTRMYENIEDTKIITYLATNTTAGNKLDLKSNAFEFAGNYAQDDIADITQIKPSELLKYNLTDCLATWYVYNKNYPKMVADNQEDIYRKIMLPSLKVICQMELTGMPIDTDQIEVVEIILKQDLNFHMKNLFNLSSMNHFESTLKMEALLARQKKLKVKKANISEFDNLEFNPGSNKQTVKLLYEHFNLPVTDTTDSGQPAVGAKTLKKLLNQLKLDFGITDEDLK